MLPLPVQFAKDRFHLTLAEGLKKDDGSKVQSFKIIEQEKGKLEIWCIVVSRNKHNVRNSII